VLPLQPQWSWAVSNLDSRHFVPLSGQWIIVLSFPGEFASTTLICPQNLRIQGMTVTLDVIITGNAATFYFEWKPSGWNRYWRENIVNLYLNQLSFHSKKKIWTLLCNFILLCTFNGKIFPLNHKVKTHIIVILTITTDFRGLLDFSYFKFPSFPLKTEIMLW
jgi:hypothetical protein